MNNTRDAWWMPAIRKLAVLSIVVALVSGPIQALAQELPGYEDYPEGHEVNRPGFPGGSPG